VLFALNLCCFPESEAPPEVFAAILAGAAEVVKESGGALIGGHSVRDTELKFGLSVVGEADPQRLLTNAGARPGQRLVLTKPLGTGVILNAFKFGKIDEEELEPALAGMERSNARASELALATGATGATDITGFGLAGHGLEVARASGVGLRVRFAALPVYPGFYELARKGVTTGCTDHNERACQAQFEDRAGLGRYERELLFDPQTSGGLLIAVPPENAPALVADLLAGGHAAAEIGEVVEGPARFEIV
jgi:selenide,water dikinase